MAEYKPRFARSTDAVHSGSSTRRPHNALAPGIAQTATYTFESTADLEQYMRGEDTDPDREEYGRYGNPTVRELEQRVAALEATKDAAAFSTGMAAITSTLLALLKQGDHVVLFRDGYRRTRQFVSESFDLPHGFVVVRRGEGGANECQPLPVRRETPAEFLPQGIELSVESRIVRHGRAR